MGRKGFGGSTLILIVVLLGALYGVGRIVTPPPPEPPEPPKPAPVGANTAPNPKTEQEAMKKKYMEMMQKQHPNSVKRTGVDDHLPVAPPKKKFDPNTIEVNSDYFLHTKDGAEGTAEMQKKVAEANAQRAKEKAAAEAAKATAPAAH